MGPYGLRNLGELLFETMGAGVCVTDAKGYFVRVNPAYCAIYGYGASELIGQHFTQVVKAKDRQALQKLHDDFIAGAQEIATECEGVRKDGTPITVYATAARLSDLPGGPYKITTLWDISELCQHHLKKARNGLGQDSSMERTLEMPKTPELSSIEEGLLSLDGIGELIFAATEVGICVTDSHYRYVRVNQAYCDIYGYTPHELIGELFTKVVPPEHHEALKKLHDDFLAGEAEVQTEWQVVRKDGTPITIYATAARLLELPGGPYKITTVSDVSPLKKLQETQAGQQALLMQQSKLAQLGDMLGAIAHQWKQPLTAIGLGAHNLLDMIELDMYDPQVFKNSLQRVDQQVQFMSQTANDFIDFYRPGKIEERFGVLEAIQQVLQILAGQLRVHGIKVHLQGDESLQIQGRTGEFKQAMLSILTNAKEAIIQNRPEGGQITITLHSSSLDTLRLRLCDNGGGIDKTLLPDRLFERFSTTKEQSGSGVGLMLAKTIIQEGFKGIIQASNTHEGACILIALQKATP